MMAGRVQATLCLSTKKEAEHVVNALVSCLECTLLEHLATDAFTLKREFSASMRDDR